MTSDEIKNASSGQIADILADYNNWRRGKPPYEEPYSLIISARKLGLCIDRAIEILRGESLNTKSPENGNSEKVVYKSAKMREALEDFIEAYEEESDADIEMMYNAYHKAKAAISASSVLMCNNMKMREVLKSASERLRKATESEKFGEDVLYLVGCMRSVAQELQYGLAEPPRNCDEYSDFNAAIRRFAKERPNESGKWDMARYAQFAQWLFAKVKGEADEQ